MPTPAETPDHLLHVALHDQELGEIDYRLFNAHTGREERENGWVRLHTAPFDCETGVFTDRRLSDVSESAHPVNIAWLLESPELMKKHRRTLRDVGHLYDKILTFDEGVLSQFGQTVFCPMGGSWVAEDEWAVYPKSRNLSVICSKQNYLTGHKLRFKAVKCFGSAIEGLYGKAFTPIGKKLDGLKDYRFSLAIENCREDFYFTEKLIDCFATGTVPIYWGCPSIGRFFEAKGILSFRTLRELGRIIGSLTPQLYEELLPAVRKNFVLARKHRVVERHIYRALHGDLPFGLAGLNTFMPPNSL